MLHIKFHFDWPSSFREEDLWKVCMDNRLAKVKRWPWPVLITYLHLLHLLFASTSFQASGCNSFQKIHSFHFFPCESLCFRIWPCSKIGQGHPRVIIFIKLWWAEFPDATYQVSWKLAHRFWRRRFLSGFYHIWVWRPSWSCDQDIANHISMPLPKEASHKISTWLAKHFQRRRSLKLWTTDGGMTEGQTPDHGHPISSPCEPSAQVS